VPGIVVVGFMTTFSKTAARLAPASRLAVDHHSPVPQSVRRASPGAPRQLKNIDFGWSEKTVEAVRLRFVEYLVERATGIAHSQLRWRVSGTHRSDARPMWKTRGKDARSPRSMHFVNGVFLSEQLL
jgi:hypothetical protein